MATLPQKFVRQLLPLFDGNRVLDHMWLAEIGVPVEVVKALLMAHYPGPAGSDTEFMLNENGEPQPYLVGVLGRDLLRWLAIDVGADRGSIVAVDGIEGLGRQGNEYKRLILGAMRKPTHQDCAGAAQGTRSDSE